MKMIISRCGVTNSPTQTAEWFGLVSHRGATWWMLLKRTADAAAVFFRSYSINQTPVVY